MKFIGAMVSVFRFKDDEEEEQGKFEKTMFACISHLLACSYVLHLDVPRR